MNNDQPQLDGTESLRRQAAPIVGSIRILGLTMQDVHFICDSEGLPYPGQRGARTSLTDDRPRATWNYTEAEREDTWKIYRIAHNLGYQILWSGKEWPGEPPKSTITVVGNGPCGRTQTGRPHSVLETGDHPHEPGTPTP